MLIGGQKKRKATKRGYDAMAFICFCVSKVFLKQEIMGYKACQVRL